MSWLREQASRVRRYRLAVVERDPQPKHPELVITEADELYLTTRHDTSHPLPSTAVALTASNPRLVALRRIYAGLDLPSLQASRWHESAVASDLDFRYFRGDTLITWHYRELLRPTQLKYFIYAQYVRDRDELRLLERLTEDGAFGCWTFTYPGHPRYSRDLLESVNEISFLERELGLSSRERFSVLDIGAGYGRLAHRMTAAYPQLDDYCCVDAVPESTFLCEYYLEHRGCAPPARVVSLDQISTLAPGSFDLAINIHSFPECTYAAVQWWLELITQLKIPRLLIVPNDARNLLSLEEDGTHRDFEPLLEAAGFHLAAGEETIRDPAVAALIGINDHFLLFFADVS
jgi:SAM-dependent methyltransferase